MQPNIQPAGFVSERWHLNGFNLSEIIVIRDGPAPDGKTYLDGRHQLSVRHCATIDEARAAVDEHNAGLAV